MTDQKVELFDTHTHIHFDDYGLDADEVWQSAQQAGVSRMIAVGCRLVDSQGAVTFAQHHDGVWAAVGIHPHEAVEFLSTANAKKDFEKLLCSLQADKIVAIGEIGLDYYYDHSPKNSQKELLTWQLELAQKYNVPVIFHIRDAFADFWPIYDQFAVKAGIVHSFTGVEDDVNEIVKRGLFIGLNGIMTFTKQNEQLEAVKTIPLNKLVLETDAPYLTPKPFRGKICKPEYVMLTAKFLAELRNEPLERLAHQTTDNARVLFNV